MKSVLLWVLALLITAATAVYQRVTGPTYPVRGTVQVDATPISFKLLRSHGGEGDAEIAILDPEGKLSGRMVWRRFMSHDDWRIAQLEHEGDQLIARVPHQPAAGKVQYRIALSSERGEEVWLTEEPVIIRFKGAVPSFVLIPHIIGMVLAMLFSARTGLEAIAGGKRTHGLAIATMLSLFIGGLIFGPIVQKYAFDAYWTGWPFGHDLTDNKAAVALLFWLVAYWRMRKDHKSRAWPLIASIVVLIIWLIPHSMLGSELDYTQLESTTQVAGSAA
jgi:hypothetical protein